jgi:IS605 OrfB family transposase
VLLDAYRGAVNFYIRSLWKIKGKLDKATLERMRRTRLTNRYKANALRNALSIVISTRKACKVIKQWSAIPVFNGSAQLDAKFITIEPGKGSFDYVMKLSTLCPYKRISIPFNGNKALSKWLGFPGARLLNAIQLRKDSFSLQIDIPDQPLKDTGEVLGVDIGVNKLLALSDGRFLGTEFKSIRDKMRRRKSGSKGMQRARRERANYVNQALNRLPWKSLRILGMEDLKNLKKGKSKKRNKNFRKAIAPWVYRQVLSRARSKAQENRVRLVLVNPANTSRTCPKCGTVHKMNRMGEKFQCIACNHMGDSDHVGALNVLARTMLIVGSLESPMLKKAV